MTILVKCEFLIPIEIDNDSRESVEFIIEENSCPGTGIVGATFDDIMHQHDKDGTCWACALQAKNTIMEWDYDRTHLPQRRPD